MTYLLTLLLLLTSCAVIILSVILIRMSRHRRSTANALQDAYETLKLQNLRTEAILGDLPVGVEVYSKEGVLIGLNERSCKIFGVTDKKELLDSIPIMKNPVIPQAVKEAFQHQKKIQIDFPYDFSIVNNTGFYNTNRSKEIKRISCNGTPVFDSYGKMQNYVFIMNDITKEYEQAKQLEESIRLSHEAIQASNLVLWRYDNRSRLFSSYNDPVTNYNNDALMPTEEYISAMHHPEDLANVREYINAMDEGKDFSYEIPMRVKTAYDPDWQDCIISGTPFLKDESGKVLVYTGFRRNISSWKKLNDALLKANQQNELILNNSNSGLVYISTDHIVQWTNLGTCSTSISNEAYKKGTFCYQSTYGRNTPCEDCVMQKAILSRQTERHVLNLNNRLIESYATPIFNSHDKVEGVVLRLNDVSERERLISELSEAKERAEQSDKLKSAFLANISHEIRTPLNAIVGFSSLLMNTESQEEKMEFNRIITTNTDLLLRLINDILDLSKIEAGFVDRKIDKLDLAIYFNELYHSAQQRMTNPDVKLICENPYEHCIVQLDSKRMAQVVLNYTTNAIKYTPKGTIRMGYERCDGGLRFYVSDTGIGISEENKPRVYHRFEKLDEFAQGTGLGLSICKAITEACGGRLGFETKEGVGSTFWSWIPCEFCEPDTKETDITKVSDSDSSSRAIQKPSAGFNDLTDAQPKKILVAEDIDSNYRLIPALLKHTNYSLHRAMDGIEAVEKAKTEQFDLILMDMKMPHLNGLEATRRIRRTNESLPIIALTAHAFNSDKEAALEAGCNAYIVKPVNKELLLKTLHEYLD